jgi:hypothetical protein
MISAMLDSVEMGPVNVPEAATRGIFVCKGKRGMTIQVHSDGAEVKHAVSLMNTSKISSVHNVLSQQACEAHANEAGTGVHSKNV